MIETGRPEEEEAVNEDCQEGFRPCRLTPVARARIAKGIDPPARNKFDGLLAGPKE
jgi:hypothetical protein